MTYTNTIEKTAGAINTNGLHTDTNKTEFASHGLINQAHDGNAIADPQDLALTTTAEPRVSTQQLAKHLGNKHSSLVALIQNHRADFQQLGIQRAGRLTPGQSFSWQWTRRGEVAATINIRTDTDRVTLDYRSRDRGGEWQAMNYPVRVTWTSCNYGGHRAWWICPAVGCGRRAAVLYGGKVYACRHCHRLAYQSQREQADDRACSMADKVRDRLGWQAGILNGHGRKPKGMHWQTFERLQARHDVLVNHSLAGAMAKFGPLRELLEL